jgi:hypothetical protein
VTWEPDYSQCFTEQMLWLGKYDSYNLPASGYLVAVTLSPVTDLPCGNNDWRAEIEITDDSWVPLYRTIQWEWPMAKAGVMLWPPKPNMNSAHGYWLRRIQPDSCPDLQVTMVSLRMTYQ